MKTKLILLGAVALLNGAVYADSYPNQNGKCPPKTHPATVVTTSSTTFGGNAGASGGVVSGGANGSHTTTTTTTEKVCKPNKK